MKSDTYSVKDIFQDRRQYCVPFYQRAYVWTRQNQWEQLWEDIQAKADARLVTSKISPHFLGAVVLEPQDKQGLKGVDQLHIIDGQQRLTTLQYALAAARLALRDAAMLDYMPHLDSCLINQNPSTMRNPETEVFKVWPTFRDRDHYVTAMTCQTLGELRTKFLPHFTNAGLLRKIGMAHPASLEAIWNFAHWMLDWLQADQTNLESRSEALVSALLSDLKIVGIMLDDDDDAQVIFETLNGRGAQLHATDLIRNYLFMRADHDNADSAMLYSTYWQPFESNYWSTEQRRGRMKKPRLEWLVHASLQAELKEEVDLARLYHEYRRFASKGSPPLTAQSQLITLQDYAAQYEALVSGTGSLPIARFGKRIAPWDVTTLHPVALSIGTEEMPEDEKQALFNNLMSFVVRRAVCGLTAKNYNNIFMGLLRQFQHGANLGSLKNYLASNKGDASRWPRDDEFLRALQHAKLYPGNLEVPKIRALLTELEAALRAGSNPEEKTPPDLSELDVDHIMPRSWTEYWPMGDETKVVHQELQEVELKLLSSQPLTDRQTQIAERLDFIPTLGNLTLLNLRVNRQAQHFEFKRKRDLLLANTALRLNVPLIGLDAWSVNTIADRAELLSKLALILYPGPD